MGEKNQIKIKWIEDSPVEDEDSEVIKLDAGDIIEGLICEILPSTKWKGRNIYKIKSKDDDKIKVLVGTVMLDKAMSVKTVGNLVKIERLTDTDTDKGNPMQNYKTYSPAQ